jgi:hypothetical protein
MYAALVFGLGLLRNRIAVQNPRNRRLVPRLILGAWIFSNLAYAYFIREYSYVFLLVSTLLSAWVLFQEVNQFWRIGLVGADAEIRKGIEYSKALGLCSNSIEFLGIGASKLTESNQPFEKAIDRCNSPTRPIRFLLSSPDRIGLQNIARNAGVDETSYQERVRRSLRVIAGLRKDRAKNIEVRFYREFPAFRLMFIDDEICLASHYVLGKGDGSQLPQLQIIKGSASRDINSLYYGFRSYFDNIWQESEAWDFQRYLGE